MTFRRHSTLAALAILPGLLLATGCGSSSPSLASMSITPSPVRLAVGGSSQLALTGTFSDGTRSPVTGAAWTSSAATVAAVNSSGVVTALSSGITTVTATYGGASASVTVTVASGPVVLESISVLPPGVPLRPGATAQLTVMGSYSDGSSLNVTSGSTFSTTSSAVATVSSGGLVTAVANGTATITATHTASGLVATSTVTVSTSAPTLVSIAVSPSPLALVVPATGQLTVTGTYSDNTVVNLTSSCTFVSANNGAATVSATGLVTAVGNGTAIVTATHTASGLVGTATVNASLLPPTLTSITVAPATPTVAIGATQQLTVTGHYSDSSTVTLTTGLTYASSATGVATVSGSGLVTAVAAGSATITVTHTATSLTATSSVTVPAAVTLTSITVAPTAPSIAVGGTQQLTVTGHYSDSSTATLTTGLTYASSATGFATVSASGLVTGVAAGSATITVTHTATSLTATSSVTVTAPVTGGAVFMGSYPSGVDPLAGFSGSDTVTNPVTIDASVQFNGNASLKIAAGATCAGYIGGYIASTAPTDLHAFNALTFWAKSDVAGAVINNFGFGNDNTATGTNAFNVESHGPAAPFTGYALTTTFTKYYIPIPNPAALSAVNGLFYFSGGCPAAGSSFNVWLNDIQFETLSPSQLASTFGSVVNASTGAPTTLNVTVGTPASIGNIGPNTVNYASASAYQVGWAHFTYASSNTGVATVDANGMVVGVAAGTANVTVSFNGTTLSTIAVTVSAGGGATAPTTAAPTPSKAAANVIAMYNSSGTYTNSPGINWCAGWSSAACSEYTIAGTTSVVKKYATLNFVGTEFYANPIDASTMTHLHVDVWTPDATKFGIKPVNFGSPNQEAEVQLTNPPIVTGAWISLDIPLTDFTAINPSMAFNNLQQLLFTDNFGTGGVENGTFFIDNVYFWK
jgi:uncharacterized protein YjdB